MRKKPLLRVLQERWERKGDAQDLPERMRALLTRRWCCRFRGSPSLGPKVHMLTLWSLDSCRRGAKWDGGAIPDRVTASLVQRAWTVGCARCMEWLSASFPAALRAGSKSLTLQLVVKVRRQNRASGNMGAILRRYQQYGGYIVKNIACNIDAVSGTILLQYCLNIFLK